MANDFTGDSNCIAQWRFENGALTTDSIGSHTLTDNGTVQTETVDFKEGSVCASITGNTDYFSLTDAASPAPLSFGQSGNGIFSICGWVKASSLSGDFNTIIGKYDTTNNNRQFVITTNDANQWHVYIGHTDGTGFEDLYKGGTISTGRWYHFGFTYDQTTKAWKFRVWDDTASSIVVNTSGTTTNNMSIRTAPFTIGRHQVSANGFSGLGDEIAFFDDILTTGEIDEIRAGTYGATADTTAPVLSSPSGSATGSTTASGSVTTDEANGTLYAVVTTSATPPSAADIKAGTGAAYSTSQAVSAIGSQTVSATGLTASTTYYWHFIHTDAAANDSNIVSSTSFTTSAAITKGVQVTLYNKSTQSVQASLTGITARYWDGPTDAGAPLLKTDTASTNASGVLSLDIDAVTSNAIGDNGYLVLYKAGTGIQTDLHFASRIAVQDIA